MKHFLFTLLLCIFCTAAAQNNNQRSKDSLRSRIDVAEGADKLDTYKLLANSYYAEAAADSLKMDTLLAIYAQYDAEALKQQEFKTQGMIRSNTLSAMLNRGMYDEVIRLAPQYLTYLAEHEVWTYYYAVYRSILHARLRQGQYNQALAGAQEMYDLAKSRGHEEGVGMALYMMSSVYGQMSRPEEEEKYIRECIGIIEADDELLWLTQQAYFRLCSVLAYEERYDEALRQAKTLETVNVRYEAASKAQKPGAWINLWSVYRKIYLKTGDYDRAEIYCDKLDSIGVGPAIGYDISTTRSRIFYERGRYGDALEMADRAMTLAGNNLNNQNGAQGLQIMIRCKMSGDDTLYDLVQQAANLRDSIRNTELNASLDELRTVYEVDKLTMQKERNRLYFLFALGGCILLALALGIWIHYSRSILKKNRGLVRQIREQDRLAAELEQREAELARLRPLVRPNDPADEEVQEDALFTALRQWMRDATPYTDPELTRRTVATHLNTNETYLHDTIKRHTGQTFTEYINGLRLYHAREILADATHKCTIEEVAADSGFGSRHTFHRHFRQHYNLTPEEFRRLAAM